MTTLTVVRVSLTGPTRWATLTTEHPASSHGIPVLLDGDRVYGPADVVPIDGIARYTAAAQVREVVRRETAMPELGTEPRGWLAPATSDAIALAERFCGGDAD